MITDVVFAIVVVGSFLAIITLLLTVMIKRINILSKKNFNDKLQEYDSLIDEKEKKVFDLEENIVNKQTEVEELNNKMKSLNEVLGEKESAESGLAPTLISGGAVMENEDVVREKYHKIRSEFNFNQRDIILSFIKKHPISESERKKYTQYQRINKELNQQSIFKVLSLPKRRQEEEFRRLFTEEDVKLLDDLPGGKNDVGGFNLQKNLRSFKNAYQKAAPVYYVYTPYGDAGAIGSIKDVKIVKDDYITEGFRIMYRGRIYDYSI